jgi:cbb3-type cytochrome oxidase subunit 3
MMWWSDTGWGSWMLMGFLMVLFWGAAIALALWVVRRGRFDEAQFTRTRAILHSKDGVA